MTVAEGLFWNARVLSPHRDRAVGEDAAMLRKQLEDIMGLTSPASSGLRFRAALVALDEASREASTENWDGYGGRPVDALARESAAAFLGLLPLGLPIPEIAVDPDGEIVMEWQADPRSRVAVSIGSGGLVRYAGLFGRSRAYGTEEFVDAIPLAVAANLARLFARSV